MLAGTDEMAKMAVGIEKLIVEEVSYLDVTLIVTEVAKFKLDKSLPLSTYYNGNTTIMTLVRCSPFKCIFF